METSCVMCDKQIDLNQDEHFADYSVGNYWCEKCAEEEGKEE
ncbi:hypothetical protein [Priestia aryabhattai]|nr:hypothetical protein [Priestia aryabhattai]